MSIFGRFGPFVSKLRAGKKSAICTWRPFIFRRPICGTHGTLLGHNPSLGSGPIAAKGRDKKPLQCRLHWEAFPSSFSQFCLSLVCKQSLTSSCTHLTPNPSDKAHSAVGATSRGSRYSEIVHHNGLRLLPAFPELCPPPSCVSSHPSFGFFLSFFSYLSAVDRAWEYLLFSCCCQQFWLKQQEQTAKSCMQIKGRIYLTCDVVLERKSSASSVCLIFKPRDLCEL